MPKKFFLIACEPSGDQHSAHLIEELKKKDPGAEFRGLGGPKMAAAGLHLLEDMTQISALGLGDVIRKYFVFREIFYRALADVFKFQPDALILIDSPAFNLRFAKKIKKRFPIIYYVSPQIWAWGGRRIHTIRRTVSKMLVILPFEKKIYDDAGVPCDFIGHPLLDEIVLSPNSLPDQNKIKIGLLPGSRESEVRRIFPRLIETALLLEKEIPNVTFYLAASPNVPESVYQEILSRFPTFHPQRSNLRMHDLLHSVDFAWITSGTATLEATVIGTPFFLVYVASWTTYELGRRLVRVKYLGMVNLLADKPVVPEFIQHDLIPTNLATQTAAFLKNPNAIATMKEEFRKVKQMLGEKGASRRAAESIFNFLTC